MNTYTTTIKKGAAKGKILTLKLKKATASHVAGAIDKALDLASGSHWRELAGVRGVNEHESILWTPFGGSGVTLADPDGYAAACLDFIATIPEIITEETAGAITQAAESLFNKWIPVSDERKTPAESNQQAEERARVIEQANKSAADDIARHLAKYAESSEPVQIPEGYEAVVIELNYNDSDSQSDYFDHHHSHGPQYVIGLVVKGTKQTEKVCRSFVEKYAALSGLTWEWNKENYSMGHGYWLESTVVCQAEGVTSYGGNTDPACWWEVSLGGWRRELYPFQGYAASTAKPAKPETARAVTVNAAPAAVVTVACAADPAAPLSYTVEYDRDWTWIKFSAKPDQETLTGLRAIARFSGRRVAWYINRHVDGAEIAAALNQHHKETVSA